ncbi:FAD-dependent oxidoreductase [Micromonosporaceae bacterium Da 78-11]
MLMFQPVGGMDQIPRALTRAIGPSKIRPGCQATYGYHGDRGVLVGYYHYGAVADRYSAMPPAGREAAAVALGKRIYGAKYRTELDSSFSVAWHQVPHLEGAWHSLSGNSPQSPVFTPLTEPTGRVLYAGDWLSNMDAWQHCAILAARQAVTRLHARALA